MCLCVITWPFSVSFVSRLMVCTAKTGRLSAPGFVGAAAAIESRWCSTCAVWLSMGTGQLGKKREKEREDRERKRERGRDMIWHIVPGIAKLACLGTKETLGQPSCEFASPSLNSKLNGNQWIHVVIHTPGREDRYVPVEICVFLQEPWSSPLSFDAAWDASTISIQR